MLSAKHIHQISKFMSFTSAWWTTKKYLPGFGKRPPVIYLWPIGPSSVTENPRLLYDSPYILGVTKEMLRLCPLAAPTRESPTEFFLTVPNSSTHCYLFSFAPWVVVGGIQRNQECRERPTKLLPERWMASEGDPIPKIKFSGNKHTHTPVLAQIASIKHRCSYTDVERMR